MVHLFLAFAVMGMIAEGAYWPAAILGSALALSLVEWVKRRA